MPRAIAAQRSAPQQESPLENEWPALIELERRGMARAVESSRNKNFDDLLE